jgi:hypothetical protein
MTSVDITVTLPDDIAYEASKLGLLRPAQIAQMVRAELTRRRTEQLFAIMDQLAALPKPDLTEADIQAEIKQYRQEQREAHDRRS